MDERAADVAADVEALEGATPLGLNVGVETEGGRVGAGRGEGETG